MSTQKNLGYRLLNSVGIFIAGVALYTVLFFLFFPQFCIYFVPGMDQKDAALGVYLLGLFVYPCVLPFWMITWFLGFEWCGRKLPSPPPKPE